MWPTSPKTSGLLVLPFFLLLLALHAPQAQGRPSPTYLQLFQEIEGILNKPSVPSEVSSRDSWHGAGKGWQCSGQRDSWALLSLPPTGPLELR